MERNEPLTQNAPSLGVSRCFHFNEQQICHLRHELGFTVQRLENKMSARDRDRLHTVLREDCHQDLSGKGERVVCSFWLSIPSARPLLSSSVLAVQPDAHEHTDKIMRVRTTSEGRQIRPATTQNETIATHSFHVLRHSSM